MWQALREELAPRGFELVTVGLDTLGADGCRPFIEAAQPTHPSLLDTHHVLADKLGVVNIPSSIWIDESFTIVRPAEAAPAPPNPDRPALGGDMSQMPERFQQMLAAAAQIPNDAEPYHAALEDWVANGEKSQFALTPDEVVERSRPRSQATALGHAHFELASHLERTGDHDGAIRHFREAHRLVPDSWTFRRQAWSLEVVPSAGPMARFWQGPSPDDPEAWPYEGDWLADVTESGPENYSDRFRP